LAPNYASLFGPRRRHPILIFALELSLNPSTRVGLWLSILLFASVTSISVAEEAVTRTEDVIYGRKFGTALTLDVFTPNSKESKPGSGAAVVFVVSGGWFSAHDAINQGFINEFLKRGYTVFAVVHGSQPKFTIPEVLEDMHRAVRFIRSRADQYHIDPNRIGICGASAGGHLSLMQGTAGTLGNPSSKDPVDRESSRVHAVACFFPPTDFLNYGKPGEIAIGRGLLKDYRAPFDFHEFDPKVRAFIPITDENRILELGRTISPVNHVSKDDAPTLIIHGDADALVPIQQAEIMLEKLKAAGVPCELVTKKGQGHGWPDIGNDLTILADWFDKYLEKSPKK
jgi:acetyl esterase/lipase